MRELHFQHLRPLKKLRSLTALFLAITFLFSTQSLAFASELDNDTPTDSTEGISSSQDISFTENSEEIAGRQAFLDFFGPDGVNECLEQENDSNGASLSNDLKFSTGSPMTASDQQAVLTTSWETVGGGRINRKYLNGLVAFCYDEELAFPSGAVYQYASASDAKVSGQIAAIAQRFGKSGVDNAQWWSECQVAIWAVRAGCRSYDSATAFARSYCADRKINDPATVEDYAHIVGTLVTETADSRGTAYLYQADDPANQRILTYLAVWPDPAPSYPSPKYDTVSATEEATAVRRHSITLDRKTAEITGESLAGAVFTVYEDGKAVGTITTDALGQGSCQWQLTESASATVTKTYCSNYDKLDPETRKEISGYTNKNDALAAARNEALAAAKKQADALADQPRTVTVKETIVPVGFSLSENNASTDGPTSAAPWSATLIGDDSATFAAVNTPWSATLLIHKADGVTGETIPDNTVFALYEWNGSDYEISPYYEIVRGEDGIYTVTSAYEHGDPGRLYYTQQNQGKFALAEIQAPHGYYQDPDIWYFVITQDNQVFYGHNASPEQYEIHDDTKFANQPKPQPQYDTVTATEEATAVRRHSITLDRKTAEITGESLAGAVFTVYEDGKAVGTITTDALGQGSCQWQLTESASATVTKTYCSNYDKLDPETRKEISGYTNKNDALAAARNEALAAAKKQADALADQPRTVTVKETIVPVGFSLSENNASTDGPTSAAPWSATLIGDDSATFAAVNTPWSATLLIHKADGVTGETIPDNTVFALYEWNGSDYEISPYYEIVRGKDGIYTVTSVYEHGKPGRLYYTQQNQGKFALAEIQAPHGYVLDEDWFYFEITKDDHMIQAHNAQPHRYAISDDTKFLNQAVTGTIQIHKTGDYLTDAASPDPVDEPQILTTSSSPHPRSVFQYTSLPVANASFAIYAAEDILLPGGSHQIATYQGISLYKGTRITTITTDATGVACVEGLPLGTYVIGEVNAGNGDFLLDPATATVTLSYQDPHTQVVVEDSTHYHNQRQQISLSLIKQNPDQQPLSHAIFGLYAAEDIYGYVWDETTHILSATREPLILADTLIETVSTDESGQASFLSNLPCGMYYIRELTPPAGYLLSEEIYVIDASYTGQNGEAVLSFSHTFLNEPTELIIHKIHSETKTALAGAKLSLYRFLGIDETGHEEWALVARWTSGTTPKSLWALFPGQYRLVENQAPDGFYRADPLEFSILEGTPITTITLKNTPIPPQESELPSSPGAPTGDDSPLGPACLGLLGSIMVMIPLIVWSLRKKRR